ncbi:trypsin inhibitor [Drosophila kikkawai]|uniref:Trypsin inhibitor n=1 Tax=Drosophila kikkawai TaxID=30033 RepID=A0A6P4JEC1_DROKI|nr:PI-actitoxin-Aeq3c-like [Drosophila kikkawai]
MKLRYSLCIVLLLFVAGLWACDAQNCYDEPSQTGPCKAAFPSWRFIRERWVCEPFVYGGCRATENIFDDEEECRQLCLR